ncbi:hypothetical protein [Blastococcus deserti]|uniref:Uncharacterized protein n=1 Tax=Blastococcus deserti TaxID=2259033 RepID=A0ABW4XGU1_9ACTN
MVTSRARRSARWALGEYEVEEYGSYHWTMWAWTGAGVPSIPRQEVPAGPMA